MKEKEFNPYVVVDTNIYMTDGAVEELVFAAKSNEDALKIATILNETYNGAYSDGYNASLKDKNKKLYNDNISLTMENVILKERLKKQEPQS